MTKFEENQSPYLTFAEQASTPTTPASGLALFYRKTDNTWYVLDDAGTESPLATHAEDHASRHADGGADEITVEGLATAATDTSYTLKPDGAGGVTFSAASGSGYAPDPSGQPDDKYIKVSSGAYVFTDAPSGGGGSSVGGDLYLVATYV